MRGDGVVANEAGLNLPVGSATSLMPKRDSLHEADSIY